MFNINLYGIRVFGFSSKKKKEIFQKGYDMSFTVGVFKQKIQYNTYYINPKNFIII